MHHHFVTRSQINTLSSTLFALIGKRTVITGRKLHTLLGALELTTARAYYWRRCKLPPVLKDPPGLGNRYMRRPHREHFVKGVIQDPLKMTLFSLMKLSHFCDFELKCSSNTVQNAFSVV